VFLTDDRKCITRLKLCSMRCCLKMTRPGRTGERHIPITGTYKRWVLEDLVPLCVHSASNFIPVPLPARGGGLDSKEGGSIFSGHSPRSQP